MRRKKLVGERCKPGIDVIRTPDGRLHMVKDGKPYVPKPRKEALRPACSRAHIAREDEL